MKIIRKNKDMLSANIGDVFYNASRCELIVGNAIGVVCSVMTLFLFSAIDYTRWFEPEQHETGRSLYNWIKLNGLPSPNDRGIGVSWEIDGLELFLWNDNSISIHNGCRCVQFSPLCIVSRSFKTKLTKLIKSYI